MDSVTEGQYLLNGKNIEEYSEKQMARLRNEMFGFVVQDFALIERYTVEKNVMLPLYYSKKYKKNKKQRVEEVLKSLGIWEKRGGTGTVPLRRTETEGGHCQSTGK